MRGPTTFFAGRTDAETATPPERFFDARPAGMLVDRPDLTEEDLLTAIAERLVFEGRTGPEPQVVIEAARSASARPSLPAQAAPAAAARPALHAGATDPARAHDAHRRGNALDACPAKRFSTSGSRAPCGARQPLES